MLTTLMYPPAEDESFAFFDPETNRCNAGGRCDLLARQETLTSACFVDAFVQQEGRTLIPSKQKDIVLGAKGFVGKECEIVIRSRAQTYISAKNQREKRDILDAICVQLEQFQCRILSHDADEKYYVETDKTKIRRKLSRAINKYMSTEEATTTKHQQKGTKKRTREQTPPVFAFPSYDAVDVMMSKRQYIEKENDVGLSSSPGGFRSYLALEKEVDDILNEAMRQDDTTHKTLHDSSAYDGLDFTTYFPEQTDLRDGESGFCSVVTMSTMVSQGDIADAGKSFWEYPHGTNHNTVHSSVTPANNTMQYQADFIEDGHAINFGDNAAAAPPANFSRASSIFPNTTNYAAAAAALRGEFGSHDVFVSNQPQGLAVHQHLNVTDVQEPMLPSRDPASVGNHYYIHDTDHNEEHREGYYRAPPFFSTTNNTPRLLPLVSPVASPLLLATKEGDHNHDPVQCQAGALVPTMITKTAATLDGDDDSKKPDKKKAPRNKNKNKAEKPPRKPRARMNVPSHNRKAPPAPSGRRGPSPASFQVLPTTMMGSAATQPLAPKPTLTPHELSMMIHKFMMLEKKANDLEAENADMWKRLSNLENSIQKQTKAPTMHGSPSI